MKKILIEVVSNGFIVSENYETEPQKFLTAAISSTKVFNTKRQLNKYINENLKTEENANN